jgi:hypothetical protein
MKGALERFLRGVYHERRGVERRLDGGDVNHHRAVVASMTSWSSRVGDGISPSVKGCWSARRVWWRMGLSGGDRARFKVATLVHGAPGPWRGEKGGGSNALAERGGGYVAEGQSHVLDALVCCSAAREKGRQHRGLACTVASSRPCQLFDGNPAARLGRVRVV